METKVKNYSSTPKKIETNENPSTATSHWGGIWILGVALLLVVAIGVYQWWQQKPEPAVEVDMVTDSTSGVLFAREELKEELKKIFNQLPQAVVIPPLEELSEGLFKRDLDALNKIEEIIKSLPESSEIRLALTELFCRFVPENTLCRGTAYKILFGSEEVFLQKDLSDPKVLKQLLSCIESKTAFSTYLTKIKGLLTTLGQPLTLENVLREIAGNVKGFTGYRGIGPKAVWGITNTLKQLAPNFYKEIWEPSFREWIQNPLDKVQKHSDTPILECWK